MVANIVVANYFKPPLTHEQKISLQRPPGIFRKCRERYVKRQQHSLVPISSESSKIHLLIEVLYMPDSELSKNYLVFSDNFLYHAHKIARIAVQPYHVRYKIFQLCQCQYTIKQIAFSDIKSFSCAGLFSFFF